jgi:hypothetical protein
MIFALVLASAATEAFHFAYESWHLGITAPLGALVVFGVVYLIAKAVGED